ncbi:AcfA family outer membrane beta-barrel protein [Enterovibrio sp. ZSDZ35]|uniref:AcfA family outer membrane beta-barrel protein n=2 Tax=Enterovibrio qingdaonensis TaxID=2899818 RepID=A0ABT5QFF9_9GAMM|nr:AcfA family outer membrane beta-barrel protein [Enterovibrio sp. ZSDZ35]
MSTAVMAQPYVSLGYGYNALSHDNSVAFSDGTSLTPDSSDSIWSGSVGYRFDNDFGLELGYRQFNADASRSKVVSVVQNTQTEDEWSADLKAKQFVVMPVYFHDVNDKLRLKGGLGLTYTKYKTTGSVSRETENEVTDTESSVSHPSISVSNGYKTENSVGLALNVGTEYEVYNGLYLGANAGFTFDDVANNTQLLGTVAYYF